MKKVIKIFFGALLILVTINLNQGCSPTPFKVAGSTLGDNEVLKFNERCAAPIGVSNSPRTIEEAVTLINSLPMPVSVACFLESLGRPLKVSLTNNVISAQPASGNRSPRIFIMNENLFISVVPEGVGQDLVEFSFLTSKDMSIKAEVEFPVIQPISSRAPYDRILYNKGTSCAFCHAGETRTPLVGFANAFVSKALQPTPASKVDLTWFRNEAALCDPSKELKRCMILDSLFGHGEVRSQDFPAEFPFFQ